MRRVWSGVRTAGRWVGHQLGRVVADRGPSHIPYSNYIPNSNGEGGRVISSGNPGSH